MSPPTGPSSSNRDRISVFLEILTDEGRGQSIVTAAREDIFDGLIDFTNGRNRLIDMNAGVMGVSVPTEDVTQPAP